MRLAIVSDIHGNLAALEAVYRDIRRRGADAIVNLGDSLSGPLLPKETAAFLMAQDWVHLSGNHERHLLTLPQDRQSESDAYAYAQLSRTELDWIAGLSPFRRFSDEIFLCHASPRSDCEYFLETVTPDGIHLASMGEIEQRLNGETAAVIACGHSHLPRCVRTPAGQLIVNPGSVGLPAYFDGTPYPHRVETGSSDARYAMIEKQDGHWQAQLISVPYDAESMAELARIRGRADWVFALRYGYAQPGV